MAYKVTNGTYYSTDDFVKHLELIEKETVDYIQKNNITNLFFTPPSLLHIRYARYESVRLRVYYGQRNYVKISLPYKDKLWESNLERITSAVDNSIPSRHFDGFNHNFIEYVITDTTPAQNLQTLKQKRSIINTICSNLPLPKISIQEGTAKNERLKARQANLINKKQDYQDKVDVLTRSLAYWKKNIEQGEVDLKTIQERMQKIESDLAELDNKIE